MATMPPKRLLFSKPAWSSTTTTIQTLRDMPLFGRNVDYDEIIEVQKKDDEARVLREKEAQLQIDSQKPKAERGSKWKNKRSRTSDDSGDEDENETALSDGSSHSEYKERPKRKSPKISKTDVQTSPIDQKSTRADNETSSSTAECHSGTHETRKKHTMVINLENKDNYNAERDNLVRITAIHKSASNTMDGTSIFPEKPPHDYDDDDDDDDEKGTREIVRQIEERRRLERMRLTSGEAPPDATHLNVGRASSSRPQSANTISSPTLHHSPSRASLSPCTNQPRDPRPEDPVVEIFIKSLIPNTRQLIVKRTVSQPLQQVKEYWCKRQGFDAKMCSKIFFMWDDVRLHNSTTMRSVLNRIKARNGLNPRGINDDPANGKVEIEAITPELLEMKTNARLEMLKKLEATRDGYADDGGITEEQGDLGAGLAEEETDAVPTPAPSAVIRLACEGADPVILRVRPYTTVRKIILGYRKVRKIETDRECWLVFDGDRLDPDQTAEELQLEDEDTLEVYVK